MSEQHERPKQEEDTLPTRKVSLILVALVALSLGCVLWAALLLRSREGQLRRETAGRLSARAPEKAGPIPPDRRLLLEKRRFVDEWLAPQREKLNQWGWVDRDRGIVHIPIERAMGSLSRSQPGEIP